MSQSILSTEPTRLTQGASVSWSKTFVDYPASAGWQLKYFFRGPGAGLDLDIAGGAIVIAPDGVSFITTINGTQSKTLGAGVNYWQAWIDDGAEQSIVAGEGRTQIDAALGNLPIDQPYDGRSEVKKTLDAIRAAIAGRATQAQLRRAIAGTMIEFMSIEDLLKAETRWTQLYNAELRGDRAQAGEPFMATIHTRFVLPQ
jgi:hypothetical protein